MVKVVTMSMPVYTMQCFKFPKTTCDSLSNAMNDFWWNSIEEKIKVNCVNWEKLCLSKEHDGLGFRDIQCFNQALLAKNAWIILQNPSSLCAKVLGSRYFDQNTFLRAGVGKRSSYA